MSASELLENLRQRGFILFHEGNRLCVRPRSALTPEVRDALRTNKHDLLLLVQGIDPEVAWRLEAMRKQVPQKGTIPTLFARKAPTRPGTCVSCGDPLTPNQHYRCRPCAVAAAIAVWGTPPDVPSPRGRTGGVT